MFKKYLYPHTHMLVDEINSLWKVRWTLSQEHLQRVVNKP